MNYEHTFTDWDKMLKEGLLQGFLSNKYQTIYEYLYKRVGIDYANTWMMQGKNEKKRYCAEMILKYIDDEVVKEKAIKYLRKVRKI